MARVHLSFALLLGCALLGAASTAHAQSMDQPGTTFSDATGAMWGFGMFETSLLIDGLALAAADAPDDEAALLGSIFASAMTGVSGGVLAGTTGTPPDIPFAVHQTLWAGAGGFLLAAGLWHAADGERDGQLPVSLTFGLLSSVGAAIYSYARRDVLMRDERATTGAHLMAWGPMSVGLLTALVAGVLDLDEEAALILAGAAGILTWGLAAAIVETSVAASP